MRVSLLAAAFAATAATAMAQTMPIGPFTGQHQEDFSGSPVIFTPCMPNGVFQGTAQMCTPGHSGCHTTGSWGFFCTIFPHSPNLLFGSADGFVDYIFNPPATRFGGYFGTNSNAPDATVEFYDANMTLISTEIASFANDCQWYWNGWQINGGVSTIRIIGNSFNQGAFVMMDDMEVDYTPSGPTTYCTAGTTTNGCVPSISASGNPDVTHSSPCIITASNVEGQKSGIIFYGLAQNNVPWCSAGGSSFLCVKPPTQRTAVQMSGGTLNACDGVLSLDWNAFQIANPGALGNPWNVGDVVDVQAWFRDPPACKTTNLSDATELTYH
jgi:hypothetical protein